jgi:hypothetical protein
MTHQTQPQPPSLLAKILAFIVGTGVLALAFMFSLVALVVVAVGGLMLWGWLWWKTRAIRQQIREQGLEQDPVSTDFKGGQIIEGEVIYESETANRPERLLR